ncbi:MAG TPA: EscU/YscU/HrcU family type III secretion system export apparatus switch protein [Candidatus Dorea gallistercoris]|uniref:EscU/YscU/HrcU family type III secretion system export apparatus switch protein n=1 Tax=Candidatus Dorea gallistercoris TaxID=2838542 RepID=A0A9D1RAW0_9FIRM|nr:EscU/YscU/HrcU family type III secretion system export apparatus switch protein [Candidatus Dorea gallistercoris]
MSAFDDVLNQKAVALSYDEEGQAAPVIVASGMGYMAQRIIEAAKENGVPIYEDNSLATVLTQLDLGSEIPEELYAAIVDIYVYFLNYGKKKEEEKREEE